MFFALLSVIALVMGPIAAAKPNKASDEYVRERVLQLIGQEGYCSGVEIRAPSGAEYVLTAAHCVQGDTFIAEREDGSRTALLLVEQSEIYDLALYSEANPKIDGVEIAKKVSKHEKVHSMTHGAVMPSYRTDGELLKDVLATYDGVKTLTLVATTCEARPGSSGGPLFNSSGELVGIVSGGGDDFYLYVRLQDIQDFIKKR